MNCVSFPVPSPSKGNLLVLKNLSALHQPRITSVPKQPVYLGFELYNKEYHSNTLCSFSLFNVVPKVHQG